MIRTTVAAGVFVLGLLAPAVASPGASPTARLEASPPTAWSQYYYGPGYYRRGPSGGEVAAGVIGGLAAGALVGGAIAAQQQPQAAPALAPDMVAYCARKYRSFDPASGTYLARDGQRYYCQ